MDFFEVMATRVIQHKYDAFTGALGMSKLLRNELKWDSESNFYCKCHENGKTIENQIR